MRLRTSQQSLLLPFFRIMKIRKAFSLVCLSVLPFLSGCSEQEYGVNNTATGTIASSALGGGGGASIEAQGGRTENQEERLRRQERELERQRREIEELKRSRQYNDSVNPKPGRPIYSNDSGQRDPDDPIYRDNREDRLYDDTDDDFKQDL